MINMYYIINNNFWDVKTSQVIVYLEKLDNYFQINHFHLKKT